jgi:hypothetical protein
MEAEVQAPATPSGRVLALGVYLADREHLAAEIATELARSRRFGVDQRWAALGDGPAPGLLAARTVLRVQPPATKFELVNCLLADVSLADYDHLIVTDDDISLPPGFVDDYLAVVARRDFALAQPARTHDSYIDHPFVEQVVELEARRTRFVEIGPLCSLDRRAAALLTPFDEAAYMGWGLDFVWPALLEQAGLRLGIVDATPVAHRIRKSVTHYGLDHATAEMERFLAARPHVTRSEAFTVLEAYPGAATAQAAPSLRHARQEVPSAQRHERFRAWLTALASRLGK